MSICYPSKYELFCKLLTRKHKFYYVLKCITYEYMYLSSYETCCELVVFWQILIVFLLYKKTYFSCVFMRGSFLFCSTSLWLCIFTKLYFCTYVDLLVSLRCNRNWAHKEFNLQTPYLVLTEKIISLQS